MSRMATKASLCLTTLAFAFVGTALAAPNHPRQTSAAGAAPAVSGTNNGAACKVSFSTETSDITPPDDSTSDNTQAAGVAAVKPCAGNVIAFFTSEVTTSNAGDFIHLSALATCVGAGGQTMSPCTAGQTVSGLPGHTFFRNTVGTTETHAMNFVFPNLPRGQWRFQILPGGNNSAFLGFRTLVVEMFGS